MINDLNLTQLIAASTLDHPCKMGHRWSAAGGRPCPINPECRDSQTVYKCATCGDYDYGFEGGPGHADCKQHCRSN